MAGDFQESDSSRPSDANSGDSSSRNEALPSGATPPYVVLPTVRFDTPLTGRPRAKQALPKQGVFNHADDITQDSKRDPNGNGYPPTVVGKQLKPITTIIGKKLKEGKRVEFGDYQLLSEIARGGMGVVFHAIQKGLNRDVALKVILAGQLATDEDVQRFHAEAEAAASLQHHAIVPVYEVGQCEGHHFFSMGLVDGDTLAEAVRESPMLGQEAARILSDIANAIVAAHAKGVIHRDLKPGNILLDKSARPHVTDFGLAKRADMESFLTGTGQVIGTPNYMSPEQASGLNHLIGPRSDVYSLGAVLYFALTGRPPFQAATMVETLQQVTDQDPVPPHRLNGSIDNDIETICLKCLQKDPGSRYQSAAELEADLERYRNLEPIHARPITTVNRAWRWCKRNRGMASLAGALATLTLALAIVGPIVAVSQWRLRQFASKVVKTAEDNLTFAISNQLVTKRQAIDSFVERGNEAIQREEPATALPFFAEGLARTNRLARLQRLNASETEELEWAHRMRISSVLQQASTPIAFFQLNSETYNACLSPTGRLIAANGRDGRLSVWRIADGKKLLDSVRLREVAGSSLQFTANESRLLHASSSCLQIWDLTTGEGTITPVKTFAAIRAAKLDASEKYLVLGLNNGVIQLRDASNGKLIKNLGWHLERVNRIDLHAETNRLVTCSDDGQAMLFNLDTGDLEQVYTHSQPINWVEFDPSGKFIVTASDDAVAQVWRTRDGEAVGPAMICDDRVRVARFDPSGTRVATGSWAALARVWEFRTGKQVCDPLSHENSIPHLEFGSDGETLLTSSLDHMARLWSVKTGELVCPPMLHGYLVVKSFLLDDQRVATASADGMVRIWKYKRNGLQQCMIIGPGKVTASALSGDGSFFVTGMEDGRVFVRDVKTASDRGFHIKHPSNSQQRSEINGVAISPDCKLFAVACNDHSAQIYNATTGNPEATLSHENRVTHVEFSDQGRFILTVSDDSTVKIWHTESGKLSKTLPHPRELVTASFSTNAKWVVTCCRDKKVRIWNTSTGNMVAKPLVYSDVVESATFSPNNAWLAVCCRDHTATLWDTTNWQQLDYAIEHSGGVVTASFSPDSRFVVTGARDGTARIWRVIDGLPVGSPLYVGRGLIRAWYSRCGNFIATAGGRAAQLWDARDGKSLGAPMQHRGWVHFAHFSNDSKYLLSHTDEDAVLWNVTQPDTSPVGDLVARAQLVSGHRVSHGESLVPLSTQELRPQLTESAVHSGNKQSN